MSERNGAPSTAPIPLAVADDPNGPVIPKIPNPRPPSRVYASQTDEALRRVGAADDAAHAASSYVSTSGLTRDGRAALARLTTALGV